MFYGKGINYYNVDKNYRSIHAEVDAVNNLPFTDKRNKVNLFVFRTNKKGNVLLGATEDFSPNFQINGSGCTTFEKSKINRLGNLINLKNCTIACKIDTECFELEVLKGANFFLRNNKCFLQIEISSNNKKKIITFLKKIGYKKISNNIFNKSDYFFSNFILEKFNI